MEAEPIKIKILFTIPNFDTAGSGKALLNIATGLDREKFEPHIACLHNRGEFFKVVEESNIPIHIFNFMSPMKPRLKGLRGCFRIAKKLREIAPQIIHSFNYSSDYSEALSAKIARIPWIYTKKNMSWSGSSANAWRCRTFLATHIIAQNKDMINQFFIKKKNVTLVQRGINTNEFKKDDNSKIIRKELGISKTKKILLTVANLAPVKGIEVLIHAFQKFIISNQQSYLIIVGDDKSEYASYLKKVVKKHNLNGKVIFTGKRYDINSFYNAADIFVLPTLLIGEGCPVSLLEAMSTNTPVIASNVSGSRDILENFQDWLFEPGNTKDLLKKIKTLFILNNDKMSTLGLVMRNHIKKNYDIKYEVIKTENIYEDIFHG